MRLPASIPATTDPFGSVTSPVLSSTTSVAVLHSGIEFRLHVAAGKRDQQGIRGMYGELQFSSHGMGFGHADGHTRRTSAGIHVYSQVLDIGIKHRRVQRHLLVRGFEADLVVPQGLVLEIAGTRCRYSYVPLLRPSPPSAKTPVQRIVDAAQPEAPVTPVRSRPRGPSRRSSTMNLGVKPLDDTVTVLALRASAFEIRSHPI